MANEIQIIHDDGAETVYAIVRHLDGKWYDAAHTAWDAFVAADWADYDIAMPEVGAGGGAGVNVALTGVFPAGIAAGFYWVDFYVQAGGAAASTDAHLKSLLYYWDATSLTPAGAHLGEVDSTGTETITLQKALEVLLAWAGGKVSVDPATGVATYKGRDGETTILSVPMVSDASRLNGTIA